MPGMSRSTSRQPHECRSSAAPAVSPSGQTVTSWPNRGNSKLMSCWRCVSSSAKSSFNDFLGDFGLMGKLLGGEGGGKPQTELRPATRSFAMCGKRALMVGDDAITDREPQPGALAPAAAREER